MTKAIIFCLGYIFSFVAKYNQNIKFFDDFCDCSTFVLLFLAKMIGGVN
jgi:hypothetical protein